MTDDAAAAARAGSGLDTTVSHSARIWNYWLGGKDNFAADREAGDRVAAMLPSIVAQARADRAFLGRAIRYLAGEQAIRQFLDIGTGLPTADNTHQVAQRVAPEARIVYVDNDRHQPLHQRRPRRSYGGGGGALEQGRHAVDDLAHPAADRPVFRWSGVAATGGGVVLTLAPPPHLGRLAPR